MANYKVMFRMDNGTCYLEGIAATNQEEANTELGHIGEQLRTGDPVRTVKVGDGYEVLLMVTNINSVELVVAHPAEEA